MPVSQTGIFLQKQKKEADVLSLQALMHVQEVLRLLSIMTSEHRFREM